LRSPPNQPRAAVASMNHPTAAGTTTEVFVEKNVSMP
jgi:hypothetical protein